MNPELKRALKYLADAIAGRPGAPDGPTRGPLQAGSAPHSEPEADGKPYNKGLLVSALLAGLLATFTLLIPMVAKLAKPKKFLFNNVSRN